MIMKDVRDYDLTANNTFGIKARCRRFIEFDTVDGLRNVSALLTDADRPLLVLGGGSNLLLTKDYAGTVLHSAIHGISVDETADGGWVEVRAGSGETWDEFVELCVSNGWYGAENLSLIPGDVGASAVQNIGAYGVEAKDIIHKVEAVDVSTGNVVTFAAEECGYGYRQSRFKNEWKGRYVITYVTYRLSKTFVPRLDYGNIRAELERRDIVVPTAEQVRRVIIDMRQAKLPDYTKEGNAGSFFMNPVVTREKYEEIVAEYGAGCVPHYATDNGHEKIPAGWLIEKCGWKGRSLGRAGVHSRQALVLVNRGGATGNDILALCEAVRSDVKARFGIEMNPEVNIV